MRATILLAGLTVLRGAVAAAYSSHVSPCPTPTATIGAGPVVGTSTAVPGVGAPVNQFLGIPFAASPPQRFSPPTDPDARTGPLHATSFKPSCIQQFNYPESSRNFTIRVFSSPQPLESEDCLYLNVFAPSTEAPPGGRAVLFWIYGGNLQFGNAGQPFYDGSSFAGNQDIILVTTNYRTGVFGFSNSPDIPTGQQNSGYLDQRKALAWVQANIAHFGGDPTKVTIFGESAGGYSVKQLLAHPPSPLPFRAAILESEAATISSTGSETYTQLLALTNCSTAPPPQVDCLRQVQATELKRIIETNALAFPPVNDGVTQSNDVRPLIESKRFAQVPFFLGTNSDEGRVFAAALGLDRPDANATAFLDAFFAGQPAIQQAILKAYPAEITNSPYFLISQVLTDTSFLCPAAALANLAVQNGYAVWRYLYAAAFPNLSSFPDAGAYHSSEIPQVFGTYPAAGATRQQQGLSKYMQTAWANFAKDPAGGPGWPRLGTAGGVELGELGADGSSGETTKPLLSRDSICLIYSPLISAGGL